MPVPRLFDAPSNQHERWIHVLACLIGLSGPQTRPALIAELAREDLPGAAEAQTRETHPIGGGGVDILVRDRERRWVVAIQATLGFDADMQEAISAAHAALADQAERIIGVVITPDRKPPASVREADGIDVRHKSWLRVRDWVQERPERGGSTGVDLALLREAEYFFTPRVADLYRLEELTPHVDQPLRPTLAAIFFDLTDISPAPRIISGPAGAADARITFPRSGDATAELVLEGGALSLRLADEGSPAPLAIGAPDDWTGHRSGALAVARHLLPVAR